MSKYVGPYFQFSLCYFFLDELTLKILIMLNHTKYTDMFLSITQSKTKPLFVHCNYITSIHHIH